MHKVCIVRLLVSSKFYVLISKLQSFLNVINLVAKCLFAKVLVSKTFKCISLSSKNLNCKIFDTFIYVTLKYYDTNIRFV